ncbi:hypothetical protein J437_LFUL006623 [Ladona fulva]|uniref:J domain-containing protein n=1 Tax=Ladona fulva TaxID=123851 RepID=A0A8K0KIZ5_LADFU|nr:hypothetical protein J437_LFUL006623 [Ladona fulva]
MWKVIDFLTGPKRVPILLCSRYIFASKFSLKSHYDILGLTPKATQADVKAAYYKLSMQYHPDRNKSESAAKVFRDITAAYEVLGNYKLRKLYDRGLLGATGGVSASPVHPEEKFYKSRETRHQNPVYEGKTPIYDFDEWAKSHYGHSFAKRVAAKTRFDQRARQQAKVTADIQSERIIGLALLSITILAYITFSSDTYDVDRLENVNKNNVDISQSSGS